MPHSSTTLGRWRRPLTHNTGFNSSLLLKHLRMVSKALYCMVFVPTFRPLGGKSILGVAGLETSD